MQHHTLFYRFVLDPCMHGIACTLLAYLLAPTQFLKVMCQETGNSYYSIVCKYLRVRNFKIFFSAAHIYALRNFISALAFGIAQWIFLCSLSIYPITDFTLLVIWQSFLCGMVETVITLPSETKEIAANKGNLMRRKASMQDVYMPLFMRNILAPVAPILAYEITKHMDHIFMNMGIVLVSGTLTSILTMPFDLIATQNCGSQVPMTFLQRLKQNTRTAAGVVSLFRGSTMRIVQLVPFSMAHSLVMLFLKKFTLTAFSLLLYVL